MVVSSTDSSPCGTPPTSSSDLSRTYFNFGKVSEDPVRVTPTDFMKLITESDDKSIDMAIFLILINGLPQCHKSDVLKKFLNEIPNAYSQDSQSQHGLSYHELTAVEIPEQGRLHVPTLAYNITTSEDCYLYAMKSALKQVGDGKPIQYNDAERGLPIDTAFKDKDLNAHFYDMFSKLKKEGLSSNWGSQGVALFNLWDIGHSRTVYNFLPALHGVLHNSYSWLFFDLERDSKSLYKPPEVNPSNCHENLMKTRPRLHYLMRSAKINFPANKRVCLMFATHSGEIEESERKRIIRSIRGDFESVATKIGVKSLIDFNSIIMVEPNDHTACARIVTEKMDGLVHKALQNKCSVLFSFIFLRSFYYKNNSIIYTKKEEVKRLADELKMSNKQFAEFCKLFTSFGSFIDVSLIDHNSQFIIMKPNLFIKELDKIFHTDNPVLANTGILTLSTAQSLFGEPHATAYMDITVSFGIAVRLTKEQVELPILLNNVDDNSVLYCPNIRTTTPCTESKSRHLRLLRSWDAPPDNLMTSFIAEFLKLSPNSKVIIDNDTPSNVTKMKAYETSGKTPIEFEIMYFGYTLEFQVQTATEEIFIQIIRTCHAVMDQEPRTKTKYNFAVMCSKDPQRTKVMYELTRERHLLPCDISMCDECRKEKRHENPVFKLWNKVAQVIYGSNLSPIIIIIIII